MDLLFRRYHAAFSAFIKRYPTVNLTVTTSDIEVSFTRREADVALRMTNTPPEYLVGRKVGRVDFAVYGRKDLVESKGPNASFSDFPWIAWDEQRPDMRWLDGWLEANAPGARVAIRINFSMLQLRETISAGFGVHFLPCFEGDTEPNLARIGPVAPQYGRDIWLLTLPELRNTSRIHAFMTHMEELIRAEQDQRSPSSILGL
jgi:DNA-binding transcriptional LysR family regulator